MRLGLRLYDSLKLPDGWRIPIGYRVGRDAAPTWLTGIAGKLPVGIDRLCGLKHWDGFYRFYRITTDSDGASRDVARTRYSGYARGFENFLSGKAAESI